LLTRVRTRQEPEMIMGLPTLRRLNLSARARASPLKGKKRKRYRPVLHHRVPFFPSVSRVCVAVVFHLVVPDRVPRTEAAGRRRRAETRIPQAQTSADTRTDRAVRRVYANPFFCPVLRKSPPVNAAFPPPPPPPLPDHPRNGGKAPLRKPPPFLPPPDSRSSSRARRGNRGRFDARRCVHAFVREKGGGERERQIGGKGMPARPPPPPPRKYIGVPEGISSRFFGRAIRGNIDSRQASGCWSVSDSSTVGLTSPAKGKRERERERERKEDEARRRIV